MIIIYCKARIAIWKDFFCKFQGIFKFFFIFAQRTEQKPPQRGEFFNSASKYGQQNRAERQPVEQRAERGEQHGVESRAPRAGAQTQQEQPREHDQREQQVERRAAEGAALCARGAQRVEHQPEREAQHQRQRREHGLILHRGVHPKILLQKPSPRCGVSA